MKKKLIKNKDGKLVGMTWLEEFAELTKPERTVLMLLMKKKACFDDTAISNAEIAEMLEKNVNKISPLTKSLVGKGFLKTYTEKIELGRPISKYFISSETVRNVSDPAYAKFYYEKSSPATQDKPIEPTVNEQTLKRIDADQKVGLD